MILRFRIIRIVVWVVLFLVASNTTLFAQEAADRKIQRSEASVLISAIAETVEQNYNSASVAKELATDLQSNFRDEKYKDLTLQEFANAVGTDLRFKSGDKHLAVVYQPERAKTTGDRQNRTTDRYGQLSNFGHEEFKILPNNIGYLKVGHFSRGEHFEQAKEAVDRSMQWLNGRDAIIIDMRDNPGGFVNLVPYFASYFLEGSGVLQRCYCRSLDQTRTIDMVFDLPEPKNTMTPLFILVNEKTASAAESFAYMLKHRKRATLIGEKTVGVANPTNSFRISKDFVVQVTTWETTDISTDTNWEPGGVVPDVECESATTLAKAMALATEAAKTHKSERDTKYIAARNQLQQWLQREHPIETNKLQLIAKLEEFRDLDLLRERHVNWMGYELLDNVKNSHLAETVFQANTRFFPDSPNVYDSYGDALVANGKLHEARRSYERAIELGKNLNSEDIKTFLNNLKNVKERMSSESTTVGNNAAIRAVLMDYIEGTANGEPSRLRRAFHPDFKLYSVKDDKVSEWSGREYIQNIQEGQKRNRIGRIISIDEENDAAQAKVEIRMPDRQRIYTDYFLLLKLSDEWKIIHKSFTFKTMDD